MKHQGINRHWTIRHSIGFSIISLMGMAAVGIFGAGTTGLQLLLLVLLLPFLGIPHGALDYPLARRLLRHRYGRKWAVRFVGAYLLCMATVVLVWWMFPVLSFAGFLILTLYHFGTGDALTTRLSAPVLRTAEMLGRGGVVLSFPAAFSRQDVQQIFTHLVPESGAVDLTLALIQLVPLVCACLLTAVIGSIFFFVRHNDLLDLVRAVELVMLAALFFVLPALLAFTIYFSFMHSARHMITVACASTASGRPEANKLLKPTMLVTAATLVSGAVSYYALSGWSIDDSQLFRVLFIGIAAMTYPHVLVISLAARYGILPKQPFDLGLGNQKQRSAPTPISTYGGTHEHGKIRNIGRGI